MLRALALIALALLALGLVGASAVLYVIGDVTGHLGWKWAALAAGGCAALVIRWCKTVAEEL
jgi:hypothetical protein